MVAKTEGRAQTPVLRSFFLFYFSCLGIEPLVAGLTHGEGFSWQCTILNHRRIQVCLIHRLEDNSKVFCTYRANIKSTIPKVMFIQIHTLITQFGNSTNKITIRNSTNTAINISLNGFELEPCPCAIIRLLKPH